MHRTVTDSGSRCAVELHGLHPVAYLKGQPCGTVELDVLGNFADDSGEFARWHMRAVAFVDIPKLHENLRPCFRIGPAVQCRKLPGFDFCDMIAWPHRPSVITEYKGQIAGSGQGLKQNADADIRSWGLVDRTHLRYSIFQRFKDY